VSSEQQGFTDAFIGRLMQLFSSGTHSLLTSDGWHNFPDDAGITHAEIEALVNEDGLVESFQEWLDAKLNEIEPLLNERLREGEDADEDDSDCDCIGLTHRQDCKHWVLPN
jgi:redox-sensitive bicupin YhaK (pirin superfamily)